MKGKHLDDLTSKQAHTAALTHLALDLRWSWNHASDELWSRVDPELWSLTHNPWVVLQTVSRGRLAKLFADRGFRARIAELFRQHHADETTAGWFQQAHPDSALSCVAYFSMEFMLSEALPIYSGGLGNVAGDQLKTASDLGVPVVGVGLLYQQGYFRQEIDADGSQQALYPFNDPGQLPIQPIRKPDGEWLRLRIELPGFDLWIRTWQVVVGRTNLYLLDTNDPANLPHHRGVASELYGGGPELRLRQEIVLGVGGWRLLRALGLKPEVCHLNEGHAAFAALERANCHMAEQSQPFDLALAITRPGNVFTTHTPVDAGFDRFAPALMDQYFKGYAEEKLGISMRDLLALGRRDPNDSSEPFNMAYLALRASGAVNGVSRLHGEVSRRIFTSLFPRWPLAEVPVRHVTNGVHVPSWDSSGADEVWMAVCGKERWRGDLTGVCRDMEGASDAALWKMRTEGRAALVHFVRERLARQRAGRGAPAELIEAAASAFEENALTLGFARRFATYKRPNLLLADRERLARILTNPHRPVQLVVAGKAHPEDRAGQAMIREWARFAREPRVRSRLVFLSDYDMLLTEFLVQGVDLWINMPRRPWEACGTSGMKVLVNGGLNLSELDGWWAEAYSPEVGWAVGDGQEHYDDAHWDMLEADALYALLEREIVPEFYARDSGGTPSAWVARMRASMARLTPAFSSNRTVREYTEDYYLPAAAAFRQRAAEQGKCAAELLQWRQSLDLHWSGLRFGRVRVEALDGRYDFEVEVYLGQLDPDSVRIELFADACQGGPPVREQMQMSRPPATAGDAGVFCAQVPANRPADEYTPRVVPNPTRASVPLEAPHILWQR